MVDLIRKKKVWNVVKKIKNKKALRPYGVLVEVWKVLGCLSIGWLIKLFNKVLFKENILEI